MFMVMVSNDNDGKIKEIFNLLNDELIKSCHYSAIEC